MRLPIAFRKTRSEAFNKKTFHGCSHDLIDAQQNGLNDVTKTSPPAVHWMFAAQVSGVRQQHLDQRNAANGSTSDSTRVNSARQMGSSFPYGYVLARPHLKAE